MIIRMKEFSSLTRLIGKTSLTSLLILSKMSLSTSAASSSSAAAAESNQRNKGPILTSTHSIRGRRSHMEDEFVVSDDKSYAGVFDGIWSSNF